MVETQTYPYFLFYIFGILGLIFSVKKPKYIFWMGIFYFSARELQRSVFTRIPQFGPYLNLDDFIILLMITVLTFSSLRHKIRFPTPSYLVLLCLLFSLIIIIVNHSLIYEVQREHKAALYFLSGIFLSYNFITAEKDLEIFLKVLFIGSILASIQYLLVARVRFESLNTENIYGAIRSVGFMGLIPSIIISSFFIRIKWLESFKIKIIYFLGLSLMLANIFISQTRSVYFAILLTVIIIFFLRRELKSKSILITAIIVPFLLYIIFDQYLNFININELLFGRIQLLSDSPSTDITTLGRLNAVQIEFNAFLTSNILFGNGIGFNYFLPEANNPYISWGHIGHIAYLARLGLFGFFVYSIYIPLKSYYVLSKININELKFNYSKIFIIMGTALVISDWIQFWMSASYLGIGAFLSGTVIGIIWLIKDQRIKLTLLTRF